MKTYTDLEQSKKLVEILPIESADMVYLRCDFEDEGEYSILVGSYHEGYTQREDGTIVPVFDEHIPAWSLAALLDVLESEIDCKDGETYLLNIEKEGVWWNVWYRELYDEANPIETASTEELIDACVEMIIKLNKLNLL